MNKASSGLDQNIAALLGYLLPIIVPIIWLVTEKDNRFVRFHALQSIFFDAAVIVVSFVISILAFIPIIGWLLALLIPLALFVIWVLLMVKAFKNEYYKLPFIGDLAERQA